MKKVFGWIFICIPVINLIGIIAGSSIQRTPLGIIILVAMFFGGIALVSNSNSRKKNNEEELH